MTTTKNPVLVLMRKTDLQTLRRLVAIEERIYGILCNVNLWVTKGEADLREQLQAQTGLRWSASMRRFEVADLGD